MIINSLDIADYNITLLRCDVNNAEIEREGDIWPNNSLAPIPVIPKAKWLNMECELLIEEANNNLGEKTVSRIIKESLESTIKIKKRGFRYKSYLVGHSKENISKGKYVLTLELKCEWGYEEEIIVNFNRESDTTIALDCTAETPVILEITPSADLAKATIQGFGEDITINNLTKDVMITIDGEKGLVLENGVNKYPDYDSWGFPRLTPGANNITIDRTTLDITIKYKPRWI